MTKPTRRKISSREDYTHIFRNERGYDADGYRKGYNQFGFARDGYNDAGFDEGGFDKDAIHVDDVHLSPEERRQQQLYYGDDITPRYGPDGYNKLGYTRKGFDQQGYHFTGYDRLGFDKHGYDVENRDCDGLTFDERIFLEITNPERLKELHKGRAERARAREAKRSQERTQSGGGVIQSKNAPPPPTEFAMEIIAGTMVGNFMYQACVALWQSAENIRVAMEAQRAANPTLQP